MAATRYNARMHVWVNATDVERTAMDNLRKAKEFEKLRMIQNAIKERVKAEREKNRKKRA